MKAFMSEKAKKLLATEEGRGILRRYMIEAESSNLNPYTPENNDSPEKEGQERNPNGDAKRNPSP
jgi:hypothetical protein